jgi:hypothetical protein
MEFYTAKQVNLQHYCLESEDINGDTLREICNCEGTQTLKGRLHEVTKDIYSLLLLGNV